MEIKTKEKLSTNDDFQRHLRTSLEAALVKITKGNEFIPEVNEDIQRIKDYEDLLEDNQELTPDFLRQLVSEADWRQEWIQDIVSLVGNIARLYEPDKPNNDKELTHFLLQPDITYKNKVLSNDDRKRILNMLELLDIN